MASVRQDNVQIKLEIDGSQPKTELDNLTRRAKILQEDLKGMKRGTDEYIAANKELSGVNKRVKELRDEIGVAGLSMNQLTKLSSALNRELKDLVPGTEAFANKSKELQEVDARLSQVRREVKGIGDELEQSGGGFGNFLKKSAAFTGVQLGIEAVVSGLINLGAESVAEFQQAEGAAAQLTAALASTGSAAGLTKQELLDLSTSLEGKTILDGDSITQAQSVLLTFTKIKKGVYEEALPAIVDMATRLGGDGPADLQGATIQVGKALNDPIKGITALGKAGVSFSEDQKSMIRSLVETGDVAGAQAIILGELKTEFGGSAEAAAKAGTGPLKQFQAQVGNVKEGLGSLIVDGLQAIQPALVGALKLFAFLIEALKATPGFLVENRGLLLGLGVAILTLNAANIAAAASALAFTVVEKGRAIATTASAAAQRVLNLVMTANPIGLVIAAVALLVGGLVVLYERSEKVREVFAGLSAAAVQVFKNIKEAVLLNLGGVADLLTGIFTLDLDKIKSGVSKLGDGLKKTYTGLGDGVAGAYGAAYAEREKVEQAAAADREKKGQETKLKQKKEAADKEAAADREANLGALKRREAAIEVGLATAREGSAQELALKKQLVSVKADIEAQGEKKSADDVRVIRAKAQAERSKLDQEFAKKAADEADKQAKERGDVEKRLADLRAGALGSESERRIAQLQAAAAKEIADLRGTAAQKEEATKLLEEKLFREVAAVRQKAADENAGVELDLTKRRLALEHDEYKRRAIELQIAAQQDGQKLKGTDEQVAEGRRLIAAKLQQDLLKLEANRVAEQAQIARRVERIDEDIALNQIQRRRDRTAIISDERTQADADELAAQRAKLDSQFAADIFQADLTEAEKLAIARKYNEDKDALGEEFAQRERDRNKATADFALGVAQQGVQVLADFAKLGSDKELAQAEKTKKTKLAKLDQELKSGLISKDEYEKQKTAIETNYDTKARAIKKDAAEKEKAYKIAQAIIAGALAVIQAAPNPYLMVATGVFAAAAVAKIIATPIPEFAQGGVFGAAPKPATWREKVRAFATGGRINPTAGVADVGQRHSGGGIRMVDGATGQPLGEWERGEPYMILSRDTYANNKHLVDELIDTSLFRGGAPVRPGHYAEGGVARDGAPGGPPAAPAAGDKSEQLLTRIAEGVERFPSRLAIAWNDEDTQNVEARLDERADVRERAQIR